MIRYFTTYGSCRFLSKWWLWSTKLSENIWQKSSILSFKLAQWILTVKFVFFVNLWWRRKRRNVFPFLGFMITSLCSHMAAVHFFTDTVRNQCPYLGFTCTNFDDFNSGKCSLQCNGADRQCNRMGYWTAPSSGRGDLYLKTQAADAFPYCSKLIDLNFLNRNSDEFFFSQSFSNYSSIGCWLCSNSRYSHIDSHWYNPNDHCHIR